MRTAHPRAGRPLEVFGPADRGTPLVVGAIHGNECETTVVLSAAARTVTDGDLRCAVVLAANPDGVLLGTRGNAAAVDLNRTFPSRDWRAGNVLSRWSSETPQAVELSTGDEAASEPEASALLRLIEDLSPPWILSLHAPIGAVLERRPTGLDDALIARTGLRRMAAVGYQTPGVLDLWADERGIDCVTLELPAISHDQASSASRRSSPTCFGEPCEARGRAGAS